MARSPRPPRDNAGHGIVLDLLSRFDRSGINPGGFFLIAAGLYGGQYAALFPESVRTAAGGFCLFVAAIGLAFVVYCLVKAAEKPELSGPPAAPASNPVTIIENDHQQAKILKDASGFLAAADPSE
jgi:hypothetical protein